MITTKFALLTSASGQNVAKKAINQLMVRQFTYSSTRCQQVAVQYFETKEEARTDAEWLNAKSYKEIPGPSIFELLRTQFPGGALYKTNIKEMEDYFRKRYGDILRFKGTLGKIDTVFTFNPADFETVYRNETIWPVRLGVDSLTYYRVSNQGRAWGDIRNKVNPVMMKVQNIRQNLSAIDGIAQEFIKRLDSLLDPRTGRLSNNFSEEIKMWAFESVAFVALNTRLGLMTREKSDPMALKLSDSLTTFLEKSYNYDVAPPFWKYFETPGFKQLIKAYDSITEVTTHYIEKAMEQFDQSAEGKSVLEKLYRIDKNVAVVMAMDMLMAGMDTTSATFISTLYFLSKNPEKQEELRKELIALLPEPNMPLTEENTKNMPYLRGCIKETLRFRPIANGNFRIAGRDLVLSGYRVPKGVGVYMATMTLSNSDEYFERSAEFLPERWIKSAKATCPVSQKHNPFVYLPFGFGPRTCIGKRLAEMELETILVRILRSYRVSWVGEKPLEYINNLILQPAGEMSFKFEKL
ncbi:cytochrome P450 12B4 [Ceratitis capitata]|uniref:cytochrome P450 12B4 n=1 Tax=Ceratitis capitata TaxID=7213 RepID=UPI0007648D02|nr:cytochrome P450 12B4 [Ceratitis capitata]